MNKKILLLGIDTEKGKQALEFFKKYSYKYKIQGISFTKPEISEELLKTIKELNVREILVKTDFQKKEIENKINSNISIYTKPNTFVKESLADIVVFALNNVSGVTQILAAISEFKDICFTDFSPLLYTGDIIFSEIKNKGIKYYYISFPIYSVEQILIEQNSLSLENIGLIKQKPEDKEDYLKSPLQYDFEKFKELFYNDYFISVSYDMFLLSYIHNLSLKKFCFFEQNHKFANTILNFIDGTQIINSTNKDIFSIYNYYFLTKEDLKKQKEIKENQKIHNISIEAINPKQYKLLDLATTALDRKGSTPIIFFVCIEYLTTKLYDRKIKIKELEHIATEIVLDKKYYCQHPDLKTLIALKEKVERAIDRKIENKDKDKDKDKNKKE